MGLFVSLCVYVVLFCACISLFLSAFRGVKGWAGLIRQVW